MCMYIDRLVKFFVDLINFYCCARGIAHVSLDLQGGSMASNYNNKNKYSQSYYFIDYRCWKINEVSSTVLLYN